MNEPIVIFGVFSLLGVVVIIFVLTMLSARVTKLSRQMNVLMNHFGIDVTAVAAQEALKLMKAGRKIEAIKLYRDLTGVSLEDAKNAVEKMV
jgi:hypothetical protein